MERQVTSYILVKGKITPLTLQMVTVLAILNCLINYIQVKFKRFMHFWIIYRWEKGQKSDFHCILIYEEIRRYRLIYVIFT